MYYVPREFFQKLKYWVASVGLCKRGLGPARVAWLDLEPTLGQKDGSAGGPENSC